MATDHTTITVKVCFFASLSEKLGFNQITLDLAANNTLEDVKNQLLQRGDHWQALADTSILSALNFEMTTNNPIIHNGDEIAFFPPVTGG